MVKLEYNLKMSKLHYIAAGFMSGSSGPAHAVNGPSAISLLKTLVMVSQKRAANAMN